VSSSTLEDFLCEKGTVLNFDAVCAIACDVISAIERLQDLGILHNNITTSNILIGQCSRVSKMSKYEQSIFLFPLFYSLSRETRKSGHVRKFPLAFLMNIMNITSKGYIRVPAWSAATQFTSTGAHLCGRLGYSFIV